MPDYNNIQTYGQTPKYIVRGHNDDLLAIMFCEIKIWRGTKEDWWTPKDYIRLTEVESIDIQKSYKKIIQKATVKFPRGTVVGQRISDTKKDEKVFRIDIISSH